MSVHSICRWMLNWRSSMSGRPHARATGAAENMWQACADASRRQVPRVPASGLPSAVRLGAAEASPLGYQPPGLRREVTRLRVMETSWHACRSSEASVCFLVYGASALVASAGDVARLGRSGPRGAAGRIGPEIALSCTCRVSGGDRCRPAHLMYWPEAAGRAGGRITRRPGAGARADGGGRGGVPLPSRPRAGACPRYAALAAGLPRWCRRGRPHRGRVRAGRCAACR